MQLNTGKLTSTEAVAGAVKLTAYLVLCIMSYRGAGLAWDVSWIRS